MRYLYRILWVTRPGPLVFYTVLVLDSDWNSDGVYRLFQLRVSHQLGPLFFPKIYCNAHGEIIELLILKLRGYRCYFYGFRA